MIPNPLTPDAFGCLCVLTHRGSQPQFFAGGMVELNGMPLKITGSIGTNDPDVWLCVIWSNGVALEATLHSDVIGSVPQFEELRSHAERCPQIWHPVAPVQNP